MRNIDTQGNSKETRNFVISIIFSILIEKAEPVTESYLSENNQSASQSRQKTNRISEFSPC